MNNYLVPLNRYQFSQFYRYGYTYIPKSTLLEFNGQLSESTKQDLANHFCRISPFEYDEEYLVLHLFKVVETVSDNVYFEVQEIAAIYPLSKQAKLSIQEKIDQRIKLSEPIFESILPIIESTIQKKEIEKAIEALWHICDIEGNKNELLNLIGIDNIFKGLAYRQKGIRASKIENGDYWSILIAYDRFEYFPNETIGYFYDAGQIFAYFNNMPTFEGSGLHRFLNSLKPKILALELLSQLEKSSESEKYISKTHIDGLKRYLVTPLFLMLRDDIRNNDDIYNSALIKNLSFFKAFGKEFEAAIILLGAFFGYKKFYDLYYDKLNLLFYNSYDSKQNIQLPIYDVKEDAIIKTEEKSSNIRKELIEENNVSQNQILVQSNSEFIPSKINADESDNQIEMQYLPQFLDEKIAEKQKNDLVSKEEIQPAINDTANDINTILLNIVIAKGEISVTSLGKELNLKISEKMNKEILEDILNTIPEIEIFKDKSTKKVRLISTRI